MMSSFDSGWILHASPTGIGCAEATTLEGSPFTADLAVIDFNPLEEQGPFEVEKRLAQTDRPMH